MFSPKKEPMPLSPKNLQGIEFAERATIETIIDSLESSAKDSYNASLPLLASATLGDEKRYSTARDTMLKLLNKESSDNSFKAWMWGRVLLAANTVNDKETIDQAKDKLTRLLDEKMTPKDQLAFFTWAWGYRAALNPTEYDLSRERMMQDAQKLTKIYQEKPSQEASSNALWAWVMNLSAAANNKNEKTYQQIKAEMMKVADTKSVPAALETGLLRTAKSNDYPAWALALAAQAAAKREEKELFLALIEACRSSIKAADEKGAKAESILAVVNLQLALLLGNELQSKKEHTFSFR